MVLGHLPGRGQPQGQVVVNQNIKLWPKLLGRRVTPSGCGRSEGFAPAGGPGPAWLIACCLDGWLLTVWLAGAEEHHIEAACPGCGGASPIGRRCRRQAHVPSRWQQPFPQALPATINNRECCKIRCTQ
jgi:hypothetical protein